MFGVTLQQRVQMLGIQGGAHLLECIFKSKTESSDKGVILQAHRLLQRDQFAYGRDGGRTGLHVLPKASKSLSCQTRWTGHEVESQTNAIGAQRCEMR